ncbi:MAG: Phenylacetic acid catabolic protein [Asticcacaulis sp.]
MAAGSARGAAHAPSLEVDLGLSNLALDLVGQATDFLDLAAKIENRGRDADTLAFRRQPPEFHNCKLVEQQNGDFAQTLARQFLSPNWQILFLEALSASQHKGLAEIAAKSVRDVHLSRRFRHRLDDPPGRRRLPQPQAAGQEPGRPVGLH